MRERAKESGVPLNKISGRVEKKVPGLETGGRNGHQTHFDFPTPAVCCTIDTRATDLAGALKCTSYSARRSLPVIYYAADRSAAVHTRESRCSRAH